MFATNGAPNLAPSARTASPVFVDNVIGSKLYSPRPRGWVPPHYNTSCRRRNPNHPHGMGGRRDPTCSWHVTTQGGPGGHNKSSAGLLTPQHASLRHVTVEFGNGYSTSLLCRNRPVRPTMNRMHAHASIICHAFRSACSRWYARIARLSLSCRFSLSLSRTHRKP